MKIAELPGLPRSSRQHAPDGDSAGRAVALRRFQWIRDTWIFGALVVTVVGFSIASPDFLTQDNWLNTSSSAVEVLLLAAGQTFVIISGGIDLSVGATLGLSGMAGGWVMANGFAAGTSPALVTTVGILVALAVGLLAGLVNGGLIARYKIPPFVVTLGTLGIATGAADLVSNGLEISNIPTAVSQIGNTDIGGWVPIPVLVAAVACVITGVFLAKTRFGAYTYAIGDNRQAAVRAGIRDKRHLVKIYMMSGFLAGVAGVLVMARLSAASPTSGSNDELDAIAAVVIGGASLAGGSGTIVGSVIGTAIISVLLTGLIIVNVPPFWQLVAVGIVLIVAVYADQYGRGARA